MAYVKKEDLVIFNLKRGTLQALVTDIQWRKFRKSYKDKKTGEMKSRLKSVPYAICTISGSNLSGLSVGKKFIIAGYKLRNHAMQGKKCLVLNNQYIADFEENGERWVLDMIAESKKQSEKKMNKK
tara:strand:- start:209 stop:586 length:378 start_codon:yes stop_codon:yes gene_type:complete